LKICLTSPLKNIINHPWHFALPFNPDETRSTPHGLCCGFLKVNKKLDIGQTISKSDGLELRYQQDWDDRWLSGHRPATQGVEVFSTLFQEFLGWLRPGNCKCPGYQIRVPVILPLPYHGWRAPTRPRQHGSQKGKVILSRLWKDIQRILGGILLMPRLRPSLLEGTGPKAIICLDLP